MQTEEIADRVGEIARDFAADRPARQLRRNLDSADFQRLANAGFLLTGVPVESGGLWTNLQESTRPISEILRVLAKADPSVALVSSMHPAVLSFWLARPDAPEPFTQPWAEQSAIVARTALDGSWWGTITSEPGSGGDVGLTRTRARRKHSDEYAVSGQKHFGSGSGIASYMLTTALPETEAEADWFYMNVEGVHWDGSKGMKLLAEWDGHGMIATQSHAFDFVDYPATRFAWPGNLRVITGDVGAFVASIFTAVVVGVVQSAVEAGRGQVARRRGTLRPFEQVEWVRIENEAWLIEQAYEGMLRSVEAKGPQAIVDTLHAKTGIAELAESVTGRLCHVVGGGSFHRSSPFGWAFEDVRALGFLRPPWALAYDTLFDRTFPNS